MHDRNVIALLALLAAAGADDADDREDGGQKDGERVGFVSRIAAKATGRVVDIVDANAVLAKVDVQALMDRIDVNALLERVDLNALLDQVDVDRIVARIDVEALIGRSGIPQIVKESTGALAGSALDVLRRQLISIDQAIGRFFYRLTTRDPSTRPDAPPSVPPASSGNDVTGHYAGPVTRLLGFVLDALIIWTVFTLASLGVAFVVDLFSREELSGSKLQGIVALVALVLWIFVYFAASLSIAGRTIGMGLIGLLVVSRSGSPLSGRAAMVRTLVFPFSFPFLGLGFIGLLFGKERRALHDVAAGSVVVYDWGNRPAEMGASFRYWLDEQRSSRHQAGG